MTSFDDEEDSINLWSVLFWAGFWLFPVCFGSILASVGQNYSSDELLRAAEKDKEDKEEDLVNSLPNFKEEDKEEDLVNSLPNFNRRGSGFNDGTRCRRTSEGLSKTSLFPPRRRTSNGAQATPPPAPAPAPPAPSILPSTTNLILFVLVGDFVSRYAAVVIRLAPLKMPMHRVFDSTEFTYAPIVLRPGHYVIFTISLLMCFASTKRYDNPEEKYPVLSKVAFALWLSIFCHPWFTVEEGPVSQAKFALVILSTLLNVAIIHYHATNPHHPKFKLSAKARFWIGLHISSGVVEWLCSVIALLPGVSQSVQIYAKLGMATAALCGHVPSAFAQTLGVAGSRALMISGYNMCIIYHAFCALKLLTAPQSSFWFANTVLLFNTYVWVRVYAYCFRNLGLFKESFYTSYVMLAGITTLTGAFGEGGPLIAISTSIMSSLVYYLSTPTWSEWLDFTRERNRNSITNEDVHVTLLRLESKYKKGYKKGAEQEGVDIPKPYENSAKAFFDLFATVTPNGNKVLLIKHAQCLIGTLPREVALRVNAGLTYDEYMKSLWKLGSFRRRAIAIVAVHTCETDRDEANYVFNMIFAGARNHNEDWVFCEDRLALLLFEWNIPAAEVHQYFEKVDTNGDGHVNFEEFFVGMKLVWKFIFDETAKFVAADHCPCYGHAGTAVPNYAAVKYLKED